MGPVDTEIAMAKRGVSAIMMVGLQGSGKTTTTGKLARFLEKKHKRPMLAAADVYRPAAIEQLKVLGQRLKMPVYSDDSGDPVQICERAMKEAHRLGRDVVLFDTAGRLAIDEPLMQELEEIKLRTRPANTFLVVDAMMGQDSVNTAKTFHQRLEISGVILTKLDGDARGGAALSIKEVTGAPIKFLGIGESMDKLEEFRPEGLASRILGMGDIVGLMKDFEDVVDAQEAEKEAIDMLQGKFDMADFLKQIKTIQKMGSLADLFDKLPFFPNGMPDGMVLDDRELVRIEAMINSMTKAERSQPELFIVEKLEPTGKEKEKGKPGEIKLEFNESRVARVARGSGHEINAVKELINKFATMKEMMLSLGAQTGLIGKIPGLRQLSQMKQLAGMDMNSFMNTMGLPNIEDGQLPPGMGEQKKKFRPPKSSAARAKAKRKRKQSRKARKR
jgi:signal recognition particle subunit SRP54